MALLLRSGLALAAIMAAAALAAACGNPDDGPLDGARVSDPNATDSGGAGTSGAADGINTTGQGAGTGANTGLPCDVQQVLENRCIGCHLGPSPPALLTYDDLMKPSSDPTKNLAQKSLERMQSTSSPMPPPPAVPPDATEIATFQSWVSQQMPKGASCTTPPPTTDGGATGAGGPTVCTSGKTNTAPEGANMKPGEACITCHTKAGGPAFVVAGTVYPTAHEPNDCVGVAGGINVVITDKNGVATTIPVNTNGNFMYRGVIAAPFHAKVVNGAKERAMGGTLTAGDCNSCHTTAGANGAPGRIMAP
jgi:hypothetical protein